MQWTATASPGSQVAAASGSGAIATTADLRAGDTVTFTVHAVVSGGATGQIQDTATVTSAGVGLNHQVKGEIELG